MGEFCLINNFYFLNIFFIATNNGDLHQQVYVIISGHNAYDHLK